MYRDRHIIRLISTLSTTLTHSLRQSDIVDYRAAYFAANKRPLYVQRLLEVLKSDLQIRVG